MAMRQFNKLRGALDHELVLISGVINIAADATVSSDTIAQATCAKTATGTYTITLTDKFPSNRGCSLTFQAATAVDLVPQISTIDVSGAGTVVFKLLTGATATDPSAVCAVHVNLWVSNSTATPY